MARQPTIEWQTNGICNYDCSYCIQSRKYRQGFPTFDQIHAFLAFFESLPGSWEIKMSGGEPFAFRGFLNEVVPGLARLEHTISVLTNLSAPRSALRRFVDLVGDRLAVVSASLHLEHVSAEEFVEKAVEFRSWLRPETRFVVNNVLVPGTLHRLVDVKEFVEQAGLKYFPQIMKSKHGIAEYPSDEAQTLVRITGRSPSSRDANLAPSYFGRTCWSGVEYLVLDQTGDAWSCRTAKRFREGYLGNVLDGTVSLYSAPRPCRYDICPCTVPANRGMIEGIDAGVKS